MKQTNRVEPVDQRAVMTITTQMDITRKVELIPMVRGI